MTDRFGIVGLGYVGLPVALAFARRHPGTVGFDISERRVAALREGIDWTGEVETETLKTLDITFSSDPSALAECTFFIVAVPTPIDANRRPDLSPLESACRLVGPNLKRGDVVVFESTVYPGVTDDICAALLEETSNLKRGRDFKLGYSPERINPGDKEHSFERIIKVVSGEDAETLERVSNAYASVVEAGVHRAPTIRTAEAAKVIENTQRDLNIALMNELSLIFDRLEIRTQDVLEAAGTKWNFLPFRPGLVGGHCIGVDPYYLTSKAEELDYYPEVILAGRRINDSMGAHIAQKTVKLLLSKGKDLRKARVGVLGVTFKENVPDLRNSRVPDILEELSTFGIDALLHDPMADAAGVSHEYGLTLRNESELDALDALVLAVPHAAYLEKLDQWLARIARPGILVDVKSAVKASAVDESVVYWSL